MNLRVFRRSDGSFELADLILPDAPPTENSGRRRTPQPIRIRAHGGTVSILDEPSHTRIIVRNVEAEAVRTGRRITIRELHGALNGGTFRVAGELVHESGEWSAAALVSAANVVLDDGMSLLRYAVPVLAGAPLNLKGQLDAELRLQGEGASWDDLVRSLTGQGTVSLDPVDLGGAPAIAELSKIAELARQGRVASIHSDFVIGGRRVTTSQCTLKIGRVPMTLAGSTDFDGKIDYRINLAGLNDRLPEKARRVLGDLNVDLQGLTDLTLQGTVNQLVVRLNGLALDRDLVRETRLNLKKEDREKLKVLGRQLLDQLSR